MANNKPRQFQILIDDMSALDATIGAGPIDPGWWGDPKWWLISAVALVAIILIGIATKSLIEHQKFNVNR